MQSYPNNDYEYPNNAYVGIMHIIPNNQQKFLVWKTLHISSKGGLFKEKMNWRRPRIQRIMSMTNSIHVTYVWIERLIYIEI